MAKNKKHLNFHQFISILGSILVFIANLSILFLIFQAWRYSGLERGTFIAIFGILICILVILDIIFLVGYGFKDYKLKIINLMFALILCAGTLYGNYLLLRVNSAVGNMINSGVDQYETISASLVVYSNSNIDSVDDLDGKLIGINSTSSEHSPSSLGQRKLNEAGISPHYTEYGSVNDLFLALVNGDVECAVLPSGYKSMFEDEEGYNEYLENTIVLEQYSEEMKTGENESANLDLSMEPFNVLLIGYAPETETYGLADAIIVASVNPKTLTVTMTSIPRDSYVEIAGTGAYQKINAARGISRQCLMDTVSNLLDIDIDLYMEVNFEGIVEIVDALGGIWIDSPVEFVGQNSSTERGHYTVWVNKGGQWATGEQALAFARERHAMPNGDYDRQLNQQQVITQIVSRLLELNDVNRALSALEAAGDNLSTNISIDQLTSLFNYLLTIPNFSNLPLMSYIDIQNMRVTGVDSYYYDYGANLPLWIMVPYESSIAENRARIYDTLGIYDEGDIDQSSYMVFFAEYPYYRDALYHTYFNETVNVPDMPDFVPNFINRNATLSDVRVWANERGISLNVIYIDSSDSRYIEGAEGLVVDYSPAYGTLVEELNGEFTVYICGTEDDGETIPSFIGWSLSEVEAWADIYGYDISISYVDESYEGYNEALAGLVAGQSISAGELIEDYRRITIYVYDGADIDSGEDVPSISGDSPYNTYGMTYEEAIAWCNANGYGCIFYDSDYKETIEGTVSELWGEVENSRNAYWFVME